MSLHNRIRADIERRILSGEWKPGDRIPFEHELMVEYDCSRMTVNKALSALAVAGLINRRRRTGSFVAQQHVDMAALAIPDIREEIETRGGIYSIELLSRKVGPANGAHLQVSAVHGRPAILVLSCRHLSDRMPFAVEYREINLIQVPEAEEVDFTTTAPGSWLLENVPWTDAENRISARSAGSDCRKLDLEPDAACLMLERRTWRGGAPITFVRQIFPAANLSLVARFIGMTPQPE
ncbi:histidine utilization repressor [Altererythrobacter sp. B11]|uniref:histidine utilization repressor n=1 Tax=Altererythrobacter sp. B11 TaxID=2060312 RepID=UPI000DC70A9A|nr:histidine utilization repressor [Altererythrobacter sp. B11]BBC73389.1 histidine utilization repressor [Altererythrobacter sp. B11]